MPLSHGKSNKAFEHNVGVEMHEGKPMKQSLAIAYSLKRKAKKMAEGGMMTNSGYQSECDEHCNHPGMPHPKASGYAEHEGDDVKHNEMAMHEDDRDLNEHGEHEEGPEGSHKGMHERGFAEGGRVSPMHGEQDEMHEEDMVGRIMKQRQHMYSKGGRVANDTPITAGFKSNNFDDLVHRDDLEYSYTGKNSGDELGNAREDEDRQDMVSKIMRDRKMKKNHNPRPA